MGWRLRASRFSYPYSLASISCKDGHPFEHNQKNHSSSVTGDEPRNRLLQRGDDEEEWDAELASAACRTRPDSVHLKCGRLGYQSTRFRCGPVH